MQTFSNQELVKSYTQSGWKVNRQDDKAVLLSDETPIDPSEDEIRPFEAFLLGFGLGVALTLLWKSLKN